MMRPLRLIPIVGGLALLTAACSESPTEPVALDCESDHPAIELGNPISGNITAEDTQLADGTFYDPYSLAIEDAGTYTIRMSSTEVNAYLFLLEQDEQFIADNDDAPGETTSDAEIVRNLTRGCYMVVANTLEPEVGSYTIAVTETEE